MSRIKPLVAVVALCVSPIMTNVHADKKPLRINCGSTTDYHDASGRLWRADLPYGESPEGGWLSGGTAKREFKTVPGTDAPAIFLSERYGKVEYRFHPEPGTYVVRLLFAETYQAKNEVGKRTFSVQLNECVLEKVDPFAQGGGFLRPSASRCIVNIKKDQDLSITMDQGIINGIELYLIKKVPDQKRILFIGNSFTNFWNLTGTVESMVNRSRSGATITTDQIILGGRKLKDHWEKGEAAEAIRKNDYDWVVLQEYANWTDSEYEEALYYASKFAEVTEETDARLLLYATWAREVDLGSAPSAQQRIDQGNQRVAAKVRGKLVPVGRAWLNARQQNAEHDLKFFADPAFHPTLYSAYLSACVFTCYLTQEPLEDSLIFTMGKQQQPIEPEVARHLQSIAWQTLVE